MLISIYSRDYDINENIVGSGMSGKIFLEDNVNGKEFSNIYDLLNYANENNITISEICYMYVKDGIQYFKRFGI